MNPRLNVRRFLLLLLMTLSACSCSHVVPPAPAATSSAPDVLKFLESLQPPAPAPGEFDVEAKPAGWKHFVPIVSLQGPITQATAANMQATLNKATALKVDALILWLDTPGGDVDAGETIAHLIEAAPFKVHCIVDMTCASMGFYILQSCDTRHMTKRSRLLAHNAYLNLSRPRATIDDVHDLSEFQRVLAHSMAEHEAKRLKMSVKAFEKKIDHRDWWMTDEEAKSVGAVDTVESSVADFARSLRH